MEKSRALCRHCRVRSAFTDVCALGLLGVLLRNCRPGLTALHACAYAAPLQQLRRALVRSVWPHSVKASQTTSFLHCLIAHACGWALCKQAARMQHACQAHSRRVDAKGCALCKCTQRGCTFWHRVSLVRIEIETGSSRHVRIAAQCLHCSRRSTIQCYITSSTRRERRRRARHVCKYASGSCVAHTAASPSPRRASGPHA